MAKKTKQSDQYSHYCQKCGRVFCDDNIANPMCPDCIQMEKIVDAVPGMRAWFDDVCQKSREDGAHDAMDNHYCPGPEDY